MPGGIHPPLSVIKSWPKANHINPVRRDGGLVGLTITLFVLALATVCARLWARFVIQRNAGIDDAIIVACMVPTLGLAISLCLASRDYGFDRHVWDLTAEKAVESRKITMAIESFYVASTCLTKVSILLFYRRMAAGSVSPIFHWAVRATIVFVIGYGIVFQFTLFLGCHPIDSFWNQVDFGWAKTHKIGRDYHCFNETANVLAASAVSIIHDFLACGMPMLLFWKLQLPMRQKMALAAIFSVGFLLCVTGILRIVYIYNIYYNTYDVTWAAQAAWIWTGVEAHVAIICASAPALKVFFKKYLDITTLRSKTGGSGSGGSRFRFGPSSSENTKDTSKTGMSVSAISMGKVQTSQQENIDVENGSDKSI